MKNFEDEIQRYLESININGEVLLSSESKEYLASKIITEDTVYIFRKAKVTPTKVGAFVTLWKRENYITVPFNYDDDFDMVIVICEEHDHLGYFLFSKVDLEKLKIVKSEKSKGKNGFRVYPSWCNVESKQAIKTKKQQSDYFTLII